MASMPKLDYAEIRRLHGEGLTNTEIADAVGANYNHIGVLVRRWGLTSNRHPRRSDAGNGSTKSALSQIVAAIEGGASYVEAGALVGVTKNAVAGVLYRNGGQRKELARHVPIWDRLPAETRGCRFPAWAHNAHPTHEYCGADRKDGLSYCPAHARIAYQIEPPRRA